MSNAANNTAQTIAAVLRKTRPAIPRPSESSRRDRRDEVSVSVIPNERVGPPELVEVRCVDVRPRVDDQRQSVETRCRYYDLARYLARTALVPRMDDVPSSRHAAEREVAAFIGLRCQRRRHGDDEADHH